MCKHLTALFAEDVGTTITEYGLIVAVISLIVVVVAAVFGQNLLTIYENLKL